VGDFGRRDRGVRPADDFGQPTCRRGTDRDPGEAGQHLRGRQEGHPGAQMRQLFLQPRGEHAGQQPEFLIQGGKQ